MTVEGKAEKAASLAQVLFVFSLFVTLIWWWIGVWLFAGGALLAVGSRLLEREAVLPVVTQE